MRNIFKCFFMLFIFFHITFLNAGCIEPKSVPQYGYGKFFYGKKQHAQQMIYLLSESLEYNSGISHMEQEYTGHNASNVSVFISAKLIAKHVIISVKVNNDSDKIIAIPKKNIPNNEGLAGPNFLISSECIRLDYLGPLVSFGGNYTYPDDYISIKPGASYMEEVYLDEYYSFIPGRHYYNIKMPEVPILVKQRNQWSEFIVRSNGILLKIDSLLLNEKIKASYCANKKCNADDIRWIDVHKNDNSIYKRSGQKIISEGIWVPLVGFDEKPKRFVKGEIFPKWESNGEKYDVKWRLIP